MKLDAKTLPAFLTALLFGWMPASGQSAEPVILYGLTNIALGQAILDEGRVTNLGTNGGDGVSIFLGQADSGVMLSPGVSYPENGDYLDARVYGQLQGGTNQLLATVTGRRQEWSTYSAEVDFSALNPESLTLQVYQDARLVGEYTNVSSFFSINTGNWGQHLVRAAPFWRMPDGSIGALFEFDWPSEFIPSNNEGGEGGVLAGNRMFVRAEHPSNAVDFVSRIDVTSEDVAYNYYSEDPEEPLLYGTGLIEFSLTDVRLGVFRRPHRALYAGLFDAMPGALTVNASETNEDKGVAVELAHVSTFDLELVPVDLSEADSALIVTGVGTASGVLGTEFGTLRIENTNESLHIGARFTVAPAFVQIVVLAAGVPSGNVGVTRDMAFVHLSGAPQIIGCGLRSRRVEEPAGFVVRLDRSTTFTAADGTTLVGDELRLLAGDPVRFETFEMLALNLVGLPSFTITNESDQPLFLPTVTITRTGTNVVVTWPDPNQIFDLESSDSASEPMVWQLVTATVTFSNNYRSVTLPLLESNWFFRLRHGEPRLPPPVD